MQVFPHENDHMIVEICQGCSIDFIQYTRVVFDSVFILKLCIMLSRPAIGRLKVRCHASLLEHSTEGGSTCHPTSLYGHCSGDWSV